MLNHHDYAHAPLPTLHLHSHECRRSARGESLWWLDHLGKEEDAEPGIARLDDGNDWLQIYEVGSVVARKDAQGVLHDMEIIGHEYSAINDQMQLFYLYKTNRPIKAMVSADFGEAIGGEWSTVYLNRATGEKRESLDDEEE